MGLALAVRRLSWQLMVVLAAATGSVPARVRGAGAARGRWATRPCSSSSERIRDRRFAASDWWPRSVPRWCWRSWSALDDGRCRGRCAPIAFAVAGSASLAAAGRRWRLGGRLRALAEPGPHHRAGAGRAGAGADPDRRRHARPGRPHVGGGGGAGGRRALRARERLPRDGKAGEALEVIAETARGSIADLRDLLAELRYEEPAAPPAARGSREAAAANGCAPRGWTCVSPRCGEPRLRARWW